MGASEHSTVGVLIMAYGTPQSSENIHDYYTHIRRGRPPAPEQLEELKQRYAAIGGLSPLLDNTQKQIDGIERALNNKEEPYFKPYMGMKHAPPFIEDAVARMVRDGIRRAVGIVLAPHYSAMSVGTYIQRAQAAAEQEDLSAIGFVKSWHLQPDYIDCLTRRVKEAVGRFTADPYVLFTAHSLPEKILEQQDPYVDQLQETSQTLAERAGIRHWDFAWQSAGKTAMPWLGPDITEVIRDLHARDVRNLVICPIGFVSDHLEILYDIDIECKELCQSLGLQMERTPSLNDDPVFLNGLASVIRTRIPE